MSTQDSARPVDVHTPDPDHLFSWLRWVLIALTVLLVAFAVVTTPGVGHSAAFWSAAVSGLGLLIALVVGQRVRMPKGVLLVVVVGLWVVLGMTSPLGAFVAFPLFFLEMHLLDTLAGLVTVALTWVVVVAMLMWRQGHVGVGAVLGPLLGATVAVATVWSFRRVHAESERRLVLIEELERTRADLLTTERRAGALEERERLAAEIHDTLAQGFTSIQLLLSTVTRLLPDHPDQAAPLVDQARATASDNLQEARRLVAANAPADLTRRSLAEALVRLGETVGQRPGVAVTVAIADDLPSLTVDQEATLLRVAQSALANVAQHSGAATAGVSLTGRGGLVRLEVADGGRGFDPDHRDAESGRGYGLGLMRSRLERLGGRLLIDSAPGQGTRITAELPPTPRVLPTVDMSVRR